MVISKCPSCFHLDSEVFFFLFFFFFPCPTEERMLENSWVGVWFTAWTNPSQLSLLFRKRGVKNEQEKKKKKKTVFSCILGCRMHEIMCDWLIFNFNKTFLVVSKSFGKCSWVQHGISGPRSKPMFIQKFLPYTGLTTMKEIVLPWSLPVSDCW